MSKNGTENGTARTIDAVDAEWETNIKYEKSSKLQVQNNLINRGIKYTEWLQ